MDKRIQLYEEGIFLHAYGDDARKLSKITGYRLMITKWHGQITEKCGFPIEALDKVSGLMDKSGTGYDIKGDSGLAEYLSRSRSSVKPKPNTLTLGLVE